MNTQNTVAVSVTPFDAAELATIKASAAKAKSAESGRRVIVDLCIAHGLHSNDVSPKGEHVEVYQQVEQALAAGLFSANDFKLWDNGAKAAKVIGAGALRNELVKTLSSYISSIRRSLDRHYGVKKVKAEPSASDSKKGADDSADKPDNAVQGINPSESLEAYQAALNLLLAATRTNTAPEVQKHATAFEKGILVMINALAK
jgi:hypothetical protein